MRLKLWSNDGVYVFRKKETRYKWNNGSYAHHWASHTVEQKKSQGRVFGLKKGQNKILTIWMLTIKQLFRFQHVLYRDRLEQVQ